MSKKTHKKNKKINRTFLGPLEIINSGKSTFMRNSSTAEQHAEFKKTLVESLPKLEEELNNKIKSIIAKVEKANPYELMNYLTAKANVVHFAMVMQHESSNISEHDIPPDVMSIDRIIEYIHSLIISLPLSEVAEQNEKLCEQIFQEAQELHNLTHFKYLFAKSLSDNSYDEKVFMEMMSNVRGNMYQCFVQDYFTILVKSQDTLLQKSLALSADDIINGLDKINHEHTFGSAKAMDIISQGMDKLEQGISMEELHEDKEVSTSIENLFTLEKYNVKKLTNWSDILLSRISMKPNDCKTFLTDVTNAGWMNRTLPITKYPLLNLHDGYYYFNYYNFFDNFYRCLQRATVNGNSQYANEWKENQQVGTENNIIRYFADKLKFTKLFTNNYYFHNKNICENDSFIVFENKLIIFEIKAAALSPESPAYDFESHEKNFDKVFNYSLKQGIRFASEVCNNDETIVYEDDKRTKIKAKLPKYNKKDVFIISVYVDDCNEMSARFDKTKYADFDKDYQAILISLGDFMVYCNYFESKADFFNFITYRCQTMQNNKIDLADELDHLGLYVEFNNYPLHINTSKISKADKLSFDGFRVPFDHYFGEIFKNEQLNENESNHQKPSQKLPNSYKQILTALETNRLQIDKTIDAGLLFLSLDISFREYIDKFVSTMILRKRRGETPKILFSQCNDFNLSVACIFDDNYKAGEALCHITATMLGANEKNRIAIILIFDDKDDITAVDFYVINADDISDEEKNLLKESYKEIEEKRAHIPFTGSLKKVGRNDLCPCGSRKKYKHCCLK